jgi:hypothetical protein
MKFDFEKLDVYQKALLFINETYEITSTFPTEEKFGDLSIS